MGRKYLLVPSCSKGNGTGHLKRTLSLYRALKKTSEVDILLPCGDVPLNVRELIEGKIPFKEVYINTLPDNVSWDFILVDKRETGRDEFYYLSSRGALIGIDEGGSMRESFPYLVDILPSLEKRTPNIANIGFLDLPDAKYRKQVTEQKLLKSLKKDSRLSILISFGGEDPGGLTVKMCRMILESSLFEHLDVSVVAGPLFDIFTTSFLESAGKRCGKEPSFKVIKGMDSIKNIMYLYDFVITSYGITAFEAAAAGCRVILLNPSVYHKRLSIKAGFYEVGVSKINRKKMQKALENPDCIGEPFFSEEDFKKKSLADFVLDLAPPGINHCPGCGGREVVSRERFKDKTFFRCEKCGLDYLVNFFPGRGNPKGGGPYREEYFFSEYKRQYGKTYLEDFENIQSMAAKRLEIITSFISSGDLLDIGCAYGPFLKEAKKRGFNPEGLEIVPEAASYVESKLGIPVVCSSFEEASFGKVYRVVTMWYVVEHFSDLGGVLAKVNKILEIGGVFAFSTPNSSGITGKSNSKLFFSGSPEDHFTVWNPRGARKVLSLYGFRVKKVRSTGHHPERFPGFLKSTGGNGSVAGKIVYLLSRFFKYGDTFEIYAVKEREYTE